MSNPKCSICGNEIGSDLDKAFQSDGPPICAHCVCERDGLCIDPPKDENGQWDFSTWEVKEQPK